MGRYFFVQTNKTINNNKLKSMMFHVKHFSKLKRTEKTNQDKSQQISKQLSHKLQFWLVICFKFLNSTGTKKNLHSR